MSQCSLNRCCCVRYGPGSQLLRQYRCACVCVLAQLKTIVTPVLIVNEKSCVTFYQDILSGHLQNLTYYQVLHNLVGHDNFDKFFSRILQYSHRTYHIFSNTKAFLHDLVVHFYITRALRYICCYSLIFNHRTIVTLYIIQTGGSLNYSSTSKTSKTLVKL